MSAGVRPRRLLRIPTGARAGLVRGGRAVLRGTLLTAASLVPANGHAWQEIDPARLRITTSVLAHDSLEGRGTASRGEMRAARYLAERLRELGLVALGGPDREFALPVPLVAFATDPARARLTIRTEEGILTLAPPDFYHPGGSREAFRDFAGTLVYGGPTPTALETLEGRDVAGRVVLLGPPWDAIGEVEADLEKRGAAGALEAVPTPFYDRLRVVRGPTRFALGEPVDDPLNQSPLPRVVIGPAALRALGFGEAVAAGRLPPSARVDGLAIEVRQGVTATETVAQNIAALLPGSDPARSTEVVGFVAHYDHVGIGEPTGGDSIWNGFVDNAAGSAMLLEIARVLSRDPPPRPVLFLFTTAEEQGLLGATWFVRRPPLPLEHIRAMVNLDGGSAPPDEDRWVIAGPAGPARSSAVRAVRRGGAVVTTREPGSDSDHWAFHAAGVPALFLLPADLAEVARPHTPDDEWTADFPFEGMARYARRALAIGRALAGVDPVPHRR